MPGPGIASATISVDLNGDRIAPEAAALGREAGAVMGKEHEKAYKNELDGAFTNIGRRVGRELRDSIKEDGGLAGRSFTQAMQSEITSRARELQRSLAEIFTVKGGFDRFNRDLNGEAVALGDVNRAAEALRGKLRELASAGGITSSELARARTELNTWASHARKAEAAAAGLVSGFDVVRAHTAPLPKVLQEARTELLAGTRTFESFATLAKRLGGDVDNLAGGFTRVDAAQKLAANSGFRTGSIYALIAAVVAVLAPAVVAVGAAVIDLAASLGAVAGVGILAFLGIKNAIAAATPEGQKFDAMFSSLAEGLTRLEQTAATGVFAGLARSTALINTEMNALDTTVAQLAPGVGVLVANLTNLAVTLINRFTPGIEDGIRVFDDFATSTTKYLASNGFTDFLTYVHNILPSVMEFVASFGNALSGLFVGLAPSSQAFLFALTGLLNLIGTLGSAIAAFTPALDLAGVLVGGLANTVSFLYKAIGPLGPALVATAGYFFLMSKASAALAPALVAVADSEGIVAVATRGLGAAVDFALGPFGLLAAGLGFAAAALATLPNDSSTAAAGIQELTTALKEDNGAIGENVKQLTAQQFATSGVLDAAQRLHVATRLVVDAATGEAEAQKQVSAALADHTAGLGQATAAYYRYQVPQSQATKDSLTVTNAIKAQVEAVKTATANYNQLRVANGETALSYTQIKNAAAAVNLKPSDYLAAATANQQAAEKADQLRNSYIQAGDAAKILKLDMDELSGKSITSAEAQAAFASGVDGLATAFNKANKSITGNSNAAIENRGAVASLVATAQSSIQAIADQTHSVSQTTTAFKNYRAQLIDSVTAITGNRKAATDLVDTYLKFPKNVKTDFKGDDRDAKAKAAAAKAAALDFARGDYKAAYKADPTPANKARADALAKALDFANRQYLAQLKASPVDANRNTADAARKASAFARGDYTAVLRADANPAKVTAIGAVQYIDGLRATIQVNAQVNSKFSQGLLGADGGIVGPGGFLAGGKPIHKFAFGGLVNTPTFLAPNALVGEAGLEAIVPLTKPLDQVDKSVRQLAAYARGMGDGYGSGPTKIITIAPNITVPTSDPVAVAGYVVDRLVPSL